ncbi:MAG: O-antigen ligase family protein [Syntrophothermus sp.]
MLLKQNQLSNRRTALVIAIVAVVLGVVVGFLINKVENPLYILVAVASIIGFVAAIASVEFGLLLLVFITYTRFSDIAVHNYNAPSIAKSFIVILLIGIFIRWVISQEKPRGLLLPTVLVLAYGLVGFASLLYAPDQAAVVEALNNYVKDALIAIVVVALLKRPAQFRNVIYTLLIVGAFIGTISVHQYVTGNFTNSYGGFAVAEYMNIIGETNGYRLSGPVGDPNFFSQVMVVLAMLGVERLMHEKRLFWKLMAGWAAAASTLTVVFTFSRGTTIALAISLIIFFWIYKLKPGQLIVIVVLGIAMLAFAPPTYYQRILSIADVLPTSNGEINIRKDRAIQGRASENLTAWVMVMDRPFMGVGLNNFSYLYQDYTKTLGLAPSAQNRSPHNLYLEVAAETGIVGLLVFLTMIFLAMRSVLRARKRFIIAGMEDYANMTTGFAIAFAGYLFAALFVHAAYPRYFYLLIGISFALSNLFEQPQEQSQALPGTNEFYDRA